MIFMMMKKENAKADFIKDLAEKMSREICENSELNEQEKDAVKLKILGIVFDSALDFAKRLEKEAENGISE